MKNLFILMCLLFSFSGAKADEGKHFFSNQASSTAAEGFAMSQCRAAGYSRCSLIDSHYMPTYNQYYAEVVGYSDTQSNTRAGGRFFSNQASSAAAEGFAMSQCRAAGYSRCSLVDSHYMPTYKEYYAEVVGNW